jgi:hypothetical protein
VRPDRQKETKLLQMLVSGDVYPPTEAQHLKCVQGIADKAPCTSKMEGGLISDGPDVLREGNSPIRAAGSEVLH